MPNDVGEWGSRPDRRNADYQEPFKVAGETVDLGKLPRFGDDHELADDEAAERGEHRTGHADGRALGTRGEQLE